MALIRIQPAGTVGVNKDLSQHDLPTNAWTDAQNIRFLDGHVHQAPGYGEALGTPSVVPYFLMPVMVGTAAYWLYAGAEKIYVTYNNGGVAAHTNLTRQTAGNDVNYAGTVNGWTGTVLGGVPILNPGNASDPPQQWSLNVGAKCAALTNWPASTYCASMRAYKNFLVALNVTKNTTNYPYMVKWSHTSDPGSVPASWDETDATKDAGEVDLSDGYDHIVDGMALRDSLIICKKSSIWRMDYIGGAQVMGFRKVLGTSGALNRNCMVEHNGLLLILTGEDVIVHDGVQAVSVLDKQTRRWLFENLDSENIGKCFVFKNPFFNEGCIVYPSLGSTYADRCMVWNFVDKTVSFRSIPNVLHAACGAVDSSITDTWDGDDSPWASDTTQWNSPTQPPESSRVFMGGSGTKLYLLDSSAAYDGVIASAYVERRGLSFDAPERIKLIRGVRPRIVGNTGDTVTVSVAGTADPWDEPTYTDMTHTIGTTVQDDCFVSGRYISIKFATDTAYQWRLDSFDIDVELMGEW